jgi:uncharacterized metal-binding protein YceD (DUF177 family)
MPDHQPGSPAPDEALPRQIVRLADPGQRGMHPFTLTPDAAARAAVAGVLGIPEVRKLRLEGKLVPQGRRDWTLEAMLGATVVQECVVTLAPVVTRIDEPVTRRYLADLPEPVLGETEMPEDDSIEELPASLDLGAVMIEALSLALPPFPRAPDAAPVDLTVTEPGAAPLDAAAVRPFAGLAGLRDRLTGSDEDKDDAS